MESFGVVAIAAGVVLFSLGSRRLQTAIVTAPMAFAAFGLLIGHGGLALVELAADREA